VKAVFFVFMYIYIRAYVRSLWLGPIGTSFLFFQMSCRRVLGNTGTGCWILGYINVKYWICQTLDSGKIDMALKTFWMLDFGCWLFLCLVLFLVLLFSILLLFLIFIVFDFIVVDFVVFDFVIFDFIVGIVYVRIVCVRGVFVRVGSSCVSEVRATMVCFRACRKGVQ
jgi:hypothetical protein